MKYTPVNRTTINGGAFYYIKDNIKQKLDIYEKRKEDYTSSKLSKE